MRTMVMVGAVIGLLCLLGAFFSSSSPGQAAWAAIACAVCIIPYVGWRASQIDEEMRESRKFRAEMLELMREREAQ